MTISCKLICQSSKFNLTQIYAGFGLLEKAGLLQLQLEKDKNYKVGYHSKDTLKAVLNNEIKMIYDTSDGDTIYQDELAWCDFYFKRSYNLEKVNSLNLAQKVFALGFNYILYGPNDHLALRNYWALSNLFKQKSFKDTAVQILTYDAFFSRLLKINSGRTICNYRNFEDPPRLDLEPKIIFFAKLWDPARAHTDEMRNRSRSD